MAANVHQIRNLTDEQIFAGDMTFRAQMTAGSAKLRDSYRAAIGLHPFNRPKPVRAKHVPALTPQRKAAKRVDGAQASIWKYVADYVADWYGVPVGDLLSKTRKAKFVRPRAVICMILRDRDNSYHAIGAFVKRDRSTVISQVKKYQPLLDDAEKQVIQAFRDAAGVWGVAQ